MATKNTVTLSITDEHRIILRKLVDLRVKQVEAEGVHTHHQEHELEMLEDIDSALEAAD